MSQELSSLANSSLLWIVTLISIVIVLFQAYVFLVKSLKAGKEVGLSDKQLKIAAKTGTISAIGPSLVIVSGMLSLLVVVGAPTALMRLSYVGNVGYELLAAAFAADAYGVKLLPANMTPEIFTTALYCMALGCIGYVLIPVIFIKQLDKIRLKLAGGNAQMVTVVSSAAMLGAFAYFNAGYVVAPSRNTISMLVGFFLMSAITIIYKKTKINWLLQWGMSIAMFSGMIIGSFFR